MYKIVSDQETSDHLISYHKLSTLKDKLFQLIDGLSPFIERIIGISARHGSEVQIAMTEISEIMIGLIDNYFNPSFEFDARFNALHAILRDNYLLINHYYSINISDVTASGFLHEYNRLIQEKIEPYILTKKESSDGDISVKSLGEEFVEIKERFKAYRWECGGHYHADSLYNAWVLDADKRLPDDNSLLNCWEAAIVILHAFGVLAKAEIISAHAELDRLHSEGEYMPNEEGVAKTILGFNEPCFVLSDPEIYVKGDIIAFSTVECPGLAHVAIALEISEKTWLGSFWDHQKKSLATQMVKITPHSLIRLTDSRQKIIEIIVSTKFRKAFELMEFMLPE